MHPCSQHLLTRGPGCIMKEKHSANVHLGGLYNETQTFNKRASGLVARETGIKTVTEL